MCVNIVVVSIPGVPGAEFRTGLRAPDVSAAVPAVGLDVVQLSQLNT